MPDITGLELRSTVHPDATLTLGLETVHHARPDADEVIVRVEAAPINPSDLHLLLGPADLPSMSLSGTADRPVARFAIPPDRMSGLRLRIGHSLPVGNEGAGTVIDAGENARSMIGKKVGMQGGGMYTQYRKLRMRDVIALPLDVTAADGAAMFVNPPTALAFIKVMEMEGHSAIVHTAAASNLGQMLVKICLADRIPLVNVVRSPQQVKLLREIGATHVVDSTAEDFSDRLTEALEQTGATIAFDAVSGGRLGSDILVAMERVISRDATEFRRYGSDIHKQLYIYGALDPGPTVIDRNALGFGWGAAGFLLPPFLRKAGQDYIDAMRARVVDELTTTFSTNYTATIGLSQMLAPETLRAYNRKATGQKFLVDPSR